MSKMQHSADTVRKEDLHVEVTRRREPLPTTCVVRITHLPTGIVVTSDEQKSSLQAKQQCLEELRRQLAQIDGSESEA